MFVKLIDTQGREQIFGPCEHTVKSYIKDDKTAEKFGCPPGTKYMIQMVPGRTFLLPQDGNVVFLMNDGGDTIDSARWPEKTKEVPMQQAQAT